MKYDPQVHHRRSIRLTRYNYSSPGAYFVTICAFGKHCIFGKVVHDQMRENDCGRIVREQWLDTPRIRPQIELDAFTLIPIIFTESCGYWDRRGEHILWNSGYATADPVGSSSGLPVVGPSSAGPRRTLFGPTMSPSPIRPNSVRPYKVGVGQRAIHAANTIPPMRPRSLASWVSGFKSAVTRRIRKLWSNPSAVVWQEDYFERILRDRGRIVEHPRLHSLQSAAPEIGSGKPRGTLRRRRRCAVDGG